MERFLFTPRGVEAAPSRRALSEEADRAAEVEVEGCGGVARSRCSRRISSNALLVSSTIPSSSSIPPSSSCRAMLAPCRPSRSRAPQPSGPRHAYASDESRESGGLRRTRVPKAWQAAQARSDWKAEKVTAERAEARVVADASKGAGRRGGEGAGDEVEAAGKGGADVPGMLRGDGAAVVGAVSVLLKPRRLRRGAGRGFRLSGVVAGAAEASASEEEGTRLGRASATGAGVGGAATTSVAFHCSTRSSTSSAEICQTRTASVAS